MKRHLFTLVEMLVVIVVIAILAGIAFPVIGGMNRKGKETKARAEINAIVTAIKQYETDYGTLPYLLPSDTPTYENTIKKDFFITSMDNHDNYHKQYDEIMEILMNLRPDGHEFDSSHERLGNLKNKRYLDPPTKKVTPIDGTSSSLKSGYYFLDPWGRRYNIALDIGYDGKVNLENCKDKAGSTPNFGGELAESGNYLMGRVFVFSYGYKGPANSMANAKKNYITSWTTSK